MSNGHDNMSFLEHLEELRWHIIRSLIAIISEMEGNKPRIGKLSQIMSFYFII